MNHLFNTHRPIIVRYNVGLAKRYQYVNYYIEYGHYRSGSRTMDYRPIYYGKAFVQNNGWIEIDITDVVANYQFRQELEYNNSLQSWQPRNVIDNVANELPPIEQENSEWRTTNFTVNIVNDNGDVTNIAAFEATPFYFPEYMEEMYAYVRNAYKTNETSTKYVNEKYSGILPHIPNIVNDDFFVGFSFNKNEGRMLRDNYYKVGGIGTGTFEIKAVDYGNYNANVRLSNFLRWLDPIGGDTEINFIIGGDFPDSVIGGTAAVVSGDRIGLYGAYIPVVSNSHVTMYANGDAYAVIDNCPERYYMAWYTPFGEWQCQPLRSMSVNESQQHFIIQNTNRVNRNMQCRVSTNITAKSPVLTTEMYKLYATVMYAPYVQLIDTKLNKVYNCNLNTSDIAIADRTATPRVMELKFDLILDTRI